MIRFVFVLILASSVVLGNARLDHVSKSTEGVKHAPSVSHMGKAHLGNTKAPAHLGNTKAHAHEVRFTELGNLRSHRNSAAATAVHMSLSTKHATTPTHTTSSQHHLQAAGQAHVLQTHAQVQVHVKALTNSTTTTDTTTTSSSSSSSSDSTVTLSYYIFGLMGLGSCIVGCVFGIVFSRACMHKSDE